MPLRFALGVMVAMAALSGCVHLPADVRAEFDCVAEPGADRFGNETCADFAH